MFALNIKERFTTAYLYWTRDDWGVYKADTKEARFGYRARFGPGRGLTQGPWWLVNAKLRRVAEKRFFRLWFRDLSRRDRRSAHDPRRIGPRLPGRCRRLCYPTRRPGGGVMLATLSRFDRGSDDSFNMVLIRKGIGGGRHIRPSMPFNHFGPRSRPPEPACRDRCSLLN